VYNVQRYLAWRLDIVMDQKGVTADVTDTKDIWNYKGNINVQVYTCVWAHLKIY
jgi:hypothetical protein